MAYGRLHYSHCFKVNLDHWQLRMEFNLMQYGKWTVIDTYDRFWSLCRCECGSEKLVRTVSLKNGRSKSCGCYKKELIYKASKERQAKIDPSEMLRDNENGYKGVLYNGTSFGVRMSVFGFDTAEEAHDMYIKLKKVAYGD